MERALPPGIAAYLDIVEGLAFGEIGAEVWDTIGAEGLDEEAGLPEPSDWRVARLALSPEDRAGLRALTDEAIERFNAFDIALKERFGGAMVDLVDYTSGEALIVRPAKWGPSLQPGRR